MDGLKKNPNGIELRNFYFTTIEKLFFENFHQKRKNASCGALFRYFQVSKKSFYTFEDIDLRESHAKLHKNRVKLWEQNYMILKVRNQYLLSSSEL